MKKTDTELIKQFDFQIVLFCIDAYKNFKNAHDKNYAKKRIAITLRNALEKSFGAPFSGRERQKVDYKYISVGLMRAIELGIATKDTATYDHVVPLNTVIMHLIELAEAGALDYDEYCKVMTFEANCVCGLTKEENAKISFKRNGGLGLLSTMPKGWKWGDDVWARYKAAGIHVLEKKNVFKQIF